jgi:hypothetical protein
MNLITQGIVIGLIVGILCKLSTKQDKVERTVEPRRSDRPRRTPDRLRGAARLRRSLNNMEKTTREYPQE